MSRKYVVYDCRWEVIKELGSAPKKFILDSLTVALDKASEVDVIVSYEVSNKGVPIESTGKVEVAGKNLERKYAQGILFKGEMWQ